MNNFSKLALDQAVENLIKKVMPNVVADDMTWDMYELVQGEQIHSTDDVKEETFLAILMQLALELDEGTSLGFANKF